MTQKEYGSVKECRKYGDEGKLVDTIMADIKSIPACQYENEDTILRVVKVVEKAHLDLCRMKREKEINNATIISIIEERMSPAMLA